MQCSKRVGAKIYATLIQFQENSPTKLFTVAYADANCNVSHAVQLRSYTLVLILKGNS